MHCEQRQAIPVGTVINDKYLIEGVVGKGGMGTVYEGTQILIKRKVAIKYLDAHFDNPRLADRFQREAMAAGSIGHDNICEVTDLGVSEDGIPYLVMPLLKGGTLSSVIRTDGPLPLNRVTDICSQVLDALEAAHNTGIIHRDLKPANIFIRKMGARDDFVQLLDFGISKMLGDDVLSDLTKTGEIVGTPYYMAPEQAKGDKNLDHRIDLYALGVILYEMLTRRRPFDGESYNEILYKLFSEPLLLPRSINPSIPQSMEDLITKAMDRDPSRRFASANQMRQTLLHGSDVGLKSSPGIPIAKDEPQQVATPKPSYINSPMPPSVQLAATRQSRHLIEGVTPSSITTSNYEHEQFIMYKGKEILLRDYSNLGHQESARAAEASIKSSEVLIAQGRTDLLILSDVTGGFANKETVERLKKISQILKPYTKKLAVVGVSGIQRIFLQAITTFSEMEIKTFSKRSEALDWLAR